MMPKKDKYFWIAMIVLITGCIVFWIVFFSRVG